MPRLVFEEPKGGPGTTHAEAESPEHRQETARDNVVVVLKAATFALVIALVGAAILLTTTSGGDDGQAAETPAVPEIEDGAVPSAGPATTTPPAAIVAPEVRTQMAEITATAPPVTTRPAPPPVATPRPGREDRFVVVGRPCRTPGAYSFTRRYEPVVCAPQTDDKAVWQPVFG